MKAKSKMPFPIIAFTGREYVASEWRNVPEDCEDEAKRNPYLELQVAAPVEKPATKSAAKPPVKRRAKRKPKAQVKP